MTETSQQKKNRLQLVVMLAMVLIPVLGSSLMYYTGIGMPEGTTNNGVLIDPPVRVTDIGLQTLDGQHWSRSDEGKFRFVLLVEGSCDKLCGQLLRDMRQVHVRLAKRSTSLERWLIQFDESLVQTPVHGIEQTLAEMYPGLEQLRSDAGEWHNRLRDNPAVNTEYKGHQILLLDRRGNLIMVFNQEQSGQAMLDDIQFLIKSTQ